MTDQVLKFGVYALQFIILGLSIAALFFGISSVVNSMKALGELKNKKDK